MLAYGKLSKQQMAHESGGDNIGFEFSGVIVSHIIGRGIFRCVIGQHPYVMPLAESCKHEVEDLLRKQQE